MIKKLLEKMLALFGGPESVLGDLFEMGVCLVPYILMVQDKHGASNGDPAIRKAKHDEVKAKALEIIAAQGGIDFPAWLSPAAQGMLVDGIIELFVYLAKKLPFFEDSSAG